jgi:membrane-associated phospholipid phosphatase
LLRRIGTPLWILIINGMWCIGIVYSTLATRQHVAVDVLAGIVLGGLAAYLSLRLHVDAIVNDQVRHASNRS